MTDHKPYPFQHLIPRRNFLSVPTRDAAPPRTRDGMLNAVKAPQNLDLGQVWNGFRSYISERVAEVKPLNTPFTPPNILTAERSGAVVDLGAVWNGVETAAKTAQKAIERARQQTDADESKFNGEMGAVTNSVSEFEDAIARWLAVRDRGHHQEARDASAAAIKGMDAIDALNIANRKFWSHRSRDELIHAREDKTKATLQEMAERDGQLLSGSPTSAPMSDGQRQFLKSRSSPAPRGNFSVAPSPAEIDAANKRFWKR